MRLRSAKHVALRLAVFLAAFTLVAAVPSEAQSRGKKSKDKNVERWNMEPPVAVDLNSDPNVVEVEIVAYPQQADFGTGTTTEVWTYNGSTPGPTIEGNVGDTLIVHFYNQLAEETTIHWHGVEVPANMDGSNISQGAVPPGGYFRYEFKLVRASLFWYHPHVRSNEQVEKGLYGALLVHDPAKDLALGLPTEEHLLVLDDVLLADDGSVAESFPNGPNSADFDGLKHIVHQSNGREGNTLLVNGQADPSSPTVQEGVPVRLRIVNAANARFFRLSIPGHDFYKIGGDGGLLQWPVLLPPIGTEPHPYLPGETISKRSLLGTEEGILLTPGERADIVFTPRGSEVRIETHDFLRGRHAAYLSDDPSQRYPPLPDYLDGLPPGFGALDIDEPGAFAALGAEGGDGPGAAMGAETSSLLPLVGVLGFLAAVGLVARKSERSSWGGGERSAWRCRWPEPASLLSPPPG